MIKKHGKEIEATVCGSRKHFISDTEYKLLLEEKGEKRYIFYVSDKDFTVYKNNGKIKLLRYENIYLIKENKAEYF